MRELTAEEKAAIKRLDRAFKDWPRTLGLFSCNGTLMLLALEGEALFPQPGIYTYEAIAVRDYGRKVPNDGGCLPYDGPD